MYKLSSASIETCITVIAFRRPKLLFTTLHALQGNFNIEGIPLHIYIDGAREDVQGEREAVAQTVKVAEDFPWDGKKKIFPSEKNRGLQHGVRFAIDTSLQEYESTIIVEDDIVTSPFFFRFMISGLTLLKDKYNVAAICGHCYDISRKKFNPAEPFFLKHFACWGWATWRRSWEKVCWDTGVLREDLTREKGHREINFGIGEYVTGLLEAHHNGYINTWDTQTGVSFFLNGQMCLFPPESLTNNTGWRQGEHSTHVSAKENFNPAMAYTDITIDPNIAIEVSKPAWKAYQKYAYPIRIMVKIIRNKIINIISIVFPFLRPLKRKIKQKLANR